MAKKDDDLDVLLPNWSGAAAHGFSISGGDEGIFIKDVVQNSPAGKSGVMKEGDQIVSATIYFDDMGYEEAQKILETVDRHTVGLKLHRKGEKLSPGGSYSWNPERLEATSPDAVLSGDDEDYQRIFRTKIKPHLKSEDGSEASDQGDRTSNVHITRKVITRTIHTSGPTVIMDTDIQNPEFKIKVPRYEQVTNERSEPKLETSEMDVGVNLPGTEVLKLQMGDGQRTTRTMHIVKTKVVEVTGPDMEHGQATFHMPQLNIAGGGRTMQTTDLDYKAGMTNVKDPVIDINTSGAKTVIASPNTDADLNVSGNGDNLKGPKIDGQKLKVQLEGSGFNTQDGKLNIKMKTPNISVSGSDVNTNTWTKTEAPDLNIGMNVPEADIKISGPRTEGNVEIPAVDLNVGRGATEIKSTNFNFPGIRYKTREPDFNLEGKGAKATVNVPDIEVESGIKSPTFNKTGFTISGPKVTMPDISLEQKGPQVGLPDINLQVDSKGLNLNTSDSQVGIKQPDIREKELKFSVPSMNMPTADTDLNLKVSIGKGDHSTDLPLANIKGEIKEPKIDIETDIPDTDIRWQSTNSDLKGPKIKGDVHIPDVDLNVRGGSSKIKGPNLKMPDLSISGPKIKKPDINLKPKGPQSTADVNVPNINLESVFKGSDVNIKGPKIDIKEPDAKGSDLTFSMPSIGSPRGRAPGIDLSLKGPQAKTDHDANLPSASIVSEIKGPNVDVDVPEADIKGLSGTFHQPKVKMPMFGIGGGKVTSPDVNIDANLPTTDAILPGPKIEGVLDVPVVDVGIDAGSSKIKDPKFKMTDLSISGPKTEPPEFNLKFRGPNATEHTDVPDVNLEGDLKGPDMNIKGPKVNIEGPNAKGNGLNISMLSTGLPNIKTPEFDLNLKDPEVKAAHDDALPSESIEGEIKGPKVEIDLPEADIKGPSGSIHMPKFKMPKFGFGGGKVEGPEVNVGANVPAADISLTGPKIEGNVDVPDVDLDVGGGSAKREGVKFKMPDFNISGPKFEKPDFSWKFKGTKGTPDVDVPDVNLEGDLKGPKVKADHDIDPYATKIEGEITGPKVDIDLPEADMKGHSGKFHIPKFKKTNFGFGAGKPEGPDVNIDANLPDAVVSLTGPKIEGDIDVPDVDLDVGGGSGKIKGPKFKMPDVNISGPKFEKPDFSLKFKGPKGTADVDVPDVNLEGDLKGSDVNIKGPKVDIEGPDAKAGGLKFSMPSITLPKIKGPDLDLNVKGRELKADHDIDLPTANIEGEIKGPKVDIDVPEADVKGPSGSFHMPKFKMPKFGFGGGKVEGSDVNIDAKLPDADVTLTGPNIEGDIDVPDVDLDVGGGSGKIKGPKFKMPDFNISGPKFENPDFNLKFKGPKGTADVDVPDVNLEGDLKGPDVNIKGPKVDIEGPDAKAGGLKFSMPSITLPKIKGPDLDLNVKGRELKADHDIDLPSANIEGEIKGPKVDIDVPEADIKGPSGSFHMPKFKMPKFGFGGGKVEGPDVNIDAKLPDADVTLTGPNIEGDIDVPDVDLDVGGGSGKIKGPKFKTPDFNISGPKFEKPDFSLKFKGPKGTADVDVPDVNLEGDLKGPDLNIKGPKVDIEGPDAKAGGLKFSMPSITLPKIKSPDFDLSLKGPEVKADHDIDLPSTNIEGEIKGPKVDIDVPEADIKGPSGSFHMPKFKMPKFGFGGGKVEGPDVNIDAKLPDAGVSLTGPDIDGAIDVPDVDLDVGGGSGKIKGPKFKMPDFNISGPKLEKPDFNLKFKGPKGTADLDVPDVNLEGDLKGPDVNIKGPKVDIEGPDAKAGGLKFSMPSITLPKIKGPDFDLNLQGPEVKADYDIDLPSGQVEGGIKGPKVDIDVPEADTKGPSGSFHMPKFKMPKFGFGGGKVEGPDVNIDANIPDADVSLTGPEIEGDIDVPDVDLDVGGGSGKIKGPKFKMPDFNISGPKFEKPDFNLKFKGPKGTADVDVPDVNLEGDLKGSDVNIKGPKVDIEGPDAKAGGLKFSMPSITLPKIKGPDFDLSLKGPEVKADHDIDLPSANIEGEIKGPKVDIDVPEADIKGPSGSFHMPKFKMPKFGFGGGKVEGPDVNIDAKLPDAGVSLTGPDIEGAIDVPDVDLDVGGGSGKIKGPKLKMPDFNISGPKLEKPDFSLKFKGPKGTADVDVPDINLAGDLKGPDVNIKGPKVDIEGPDAKAGGLKFSMPSITLPKIKSPDFDLSLKGPEVKADHDIDLPSANIEGEIKGPKVDIDVPEADIKDPSGSFHMPKFKMPKFGFGGGKVEGPDVNIDAKLPDADVSLTGPEIEGAIDVPDVDLDVGGGSGKIKGPKFKMPDFNISGPKFEKPDFNLKFKGPKGTADVDVPDVNLEGDLKGPDVNIKGPKVDIEGPDAKSGGLKFSMPSITLPKIKGPDFDLSLKGPEVKADHDIDLPSANIEGEIKGPKVDLDVPEADIKGPSGSFHMPKFKMPKFGFGGGKVEGPDVNIDANLPDADVSLTGPEIEGNIDVPDVDLDVGGGSGKIKGPKFKMPDFNISGPKFDKPDLDVKIKGPKVAADVDVPDVDLQGHLKGPGVNIKGPKVDIEGPDTKGSGLKISVPSIALPKFKAPDVDLSLKGPDFKGNHDVDLPSAKIRGGSKEPKVNIDVPEGDNKGHGGKFRMPRIKLPKFGLGGGKAEGPSMNTDSSLTPADVSVTGPKIEGAINVPDVDLDVGGGSGKIKGPKFKMPDVNISGPKLEKPDFSLKFKSPKGTADVDVPDVNLKGDLKGPDVNIKGPKADIEGPDAKAGGLKFSMPSITLPKIKGPDFDLSLKGPEVKADHDIDIPSGKVEGEIKGPKVDIDVPEADIKGPSGSFHMPKFKMPKFGFGGGKVEGPDVNIDAKLPDADVSLTGPEIEGNIDVPDVDLDVGGGSGKIKGPKFKMPDFNISGPKFEKPDFNLKFKGPKGTADVDVPDVNLEGDLKGPDLNIKGPKVDIEGPDAKAGGLKFSMPSITLPKIKGPDFDLSLKGPEVKADHDIDLPSANIEGEIKGPKVDIDVPEADIKGPSGSFHMPKFKMPKFGFGGGKVEGPDVNIDAKLPDADISLTGPEIEGAIDVPDVDLDVGGGSGKIKGPKFKMPDFNMSGPKFEKPDFNLKFKGPKGTADVDVPDVNLEGDLKGPDVNIKGPKVDIEGPDAKAGGLKFSMPSITLPKIKGPDFDLSLKGPEVKADHDIDLPSANIEGEIKGPKVDIDVPEADIKGPSGSFHMPKFKMPKFGFGGGKVEGPDVNIDANLPDADVSLTGPEIEGNIDVPDVDLDVGGGSGKIKGPKFKMPDFNISGPKFEKPDFSLKFKGPKGTADVDVPDVNLQGDLKGPDVNIKGPKVDIEGPDAKAGGLKFSMPSITLPKIKGPDFDLSLKGPEVKADHDIDLPSANIEGEIKGPKVDIDVPEADIKGPSGSFHMPKFKMPKFGFGGGKVEGPDVNFDANLPDADVSLTGPEIEGNIDVPDVDLDVGGGSGKIKGPKFKMPDFNISGPKFEKPDFSLKFKGPKGTADVDVPDVDLQGDLKGPDVNIKGPKVDIEGPDAKAGGLKFSMPSITLPKIKGPDFDLSLKGPEVKADHDIDLPSANIEGEIKGPKVDIDVPEADIKGPSGSFHMPKFKMPKFGFGGGKVEGPDVNIDAKLPDADVSLSGPEIEGNIDVPDVDLDVGGGSGKIKGPKFKMPDFNISGPKFEKPDFNLKFKGPKGTADVDVPDVNLEGDLKGPDVNIKGPKVDIEGPDAKAGGLKFSMPSITLPKIKGPDFDLSLKGPEVKADHDIDVPSANTEGEIKGPKVDIDVPEADIKGPSGSFHMPKFKMPKFGFGGGKVEGPGVNIDANLPDADVSLTGPEIEGDIDVPDVDLDVGGGSGKIKGPKFKMPDFNISGPKFEKPDFNLKFKGPKGTADVDVPDVNLEGDLKGPDVNIKGPKVDIEGPDAKAGGLKFSMPSITLPKIKGPDFDFSLKGPEVKADHDIDLPSANIEGEIKGPKVDIDVPEADIKGPSGSFHMPKFKMPKFGFGGGKVEGPDVNIDAKLPDADVSLTGPEIEGDIDVPDVDLDVGGGSGKIKGPKFKMPDFNISGPKFEKPDFNLKFKGPKGTADVDVPDVNLEGDLKGPDVNIKGPKVDIEGPDAKAGGLKFSMPSITLPKIKGPDFDLNLKGPEVKADHDIDLPSANIEGEIKGPKVDIDVPEADIKGPSGSFHMPKFKMPKFGFGGGKVEGPDVNIDAKLPDADVSLSGPEIEGAIDVPDVDLDVGGGSGKIKGPKFKMPDFNISGPKFEKPDFNLKFKGPKGTADVDVPDVNLEGDLKGPDVNIKGPKVDIEGPDAKAGGLKFSMPSITLPKIKGPDFDLNHKGPEVKADHDIDLPSANIEGEIKGPKVDIDVPEADIKGPSGSFHMPKFKMPKFGFGGGKVEGPDVNIDAKLPDADVSLSGPEMEGAIDVPDVDLDVGGGSGKIKGPKFKMPDFNISGPKFEKPDFNLKFKGPKGTADVDVPDVNLGGDLKGPDVNIKGPKVDIEGPDAKAGGLKFSMPSITLPKIKGPDFDLNLKGPEVKADHDIDLPSANIEGEIKGPKVDIDVPEADIKGPSGSFHMPKFKMPKFGFGGGKVEGPDVNIDAKLPDADVSLSGPEIEGAIDVPDVDLDVGGGSGKIKGPKFKMPDFNISGPKLEKPDFNLKFKGPKGTADVDVPDVNLEGDLKGPDVNIKGPKVDIEGPDAKAGGLKFSMPSITLPKIKGPDFDLSLKGPEVKADHDIDLPSANIEGEIKGPKVDIDVPEADIKGPSGSFHMPKFKMPKFGFGGGKVEGPDVNIDANLPDADVSLTGPEIEGNIDVPDVDLDVGGGSGKIKGPKFKMPDFNISGPKFEKPDFNLKFKGLKGTADVDVPDVNLEGDLKGPDVNIKGPKVDIEGPDAKAGGLKFSMPSITLPKIKGPDFDLSLKGPEVKVDHDIDLPSANIEGEIKGPKVDLDVPEADIKGPSGSFHMPKFKMPKFGFGGGKVECPDVNVDANIPDADVNLTGPKIEGAIDVPDVDLDVGGGSGKIKGPKFKMPEFNISGPKLEKPDFSLKFKGPKGTADVDVPDVNLEGDLKGPDVNIKGPKVDIEGPDAKAGGLKFSMPSITLPKIKGPDFDLSLKGSDVKADHDADVPSAKVEGEIKGLNVDIDAPEANIKGPSSKFHMPKIRMPKFGFGGGKVEGPDVNIDASLPEADVNLTRPAIEGDMEMPDVDLDIEGSSGRIKGPKFKLPGFGISGPKIPKPDFDLELKGPKLTGDVDVPDVNFSGDIKGPKINKPGISISAPKVPKPDLGLELKGPKASRDFEVPGIEMEGDIKGKNLNIKGPKLDIEGPNVKETGAKFSMPSIHLPHITAPNVDLNFKGPKLTGDQTTDISSPSIEGEIKGPKIDVETPDIDLGGAHGQFQMPKISMPTFKMGGTKLEGADVDIKANVPETDVSISGPKIKGGVEIPEVDMDVDGKIKGPGFQMPGINISLPKIKAPNLDFGFKGPELPGGAAADINMEGDIKGSGFDIKGPKVDIEAPDIKIDGPDIKSPSLGVDIRAPEIDTDGQSAHLKMPKMKKPKFGFGMKGPQGDINAPSLDISGSDGDLNVDSADLNISTKGKKGKFKMPKFNIKSKKPAGDVKVNTPTSELDLSKPEADIKSPDLNVTLGSSDGQLNIKHPKVKKQRFGKMKLTFPDVEFDLASSKAKGELASSKIEGDLQAHNIDVSSADIEGPHINIRAPAVDVNADVALEGHGFKAKGTKLKLPSLNIKSSKMSEPNLDINLKDTDLEGEVSGDVKEPTIDIKRPEIDFDVDAPNVDIEKPESKLKMKIKKPKLNISGPKLKGSGVDINVNTSKLESGIKGPEVNIDAPSIDLQPNIAGPDLHLKGSSLKSADGDFESAEGKLKMPAINISGTKLQGPDLNLDTKGVKIGGDVKTPAVHVNLETSDMNINADGKFKGPKIPIPSIDISTPKLDLNSKHPQIKGDVNISNPNMKGNFRGPDVHVKGPSIDVSGADIEVKGGEGKLKMPQINLPKADINLAGQMIKGTSASDFDVNVRGPKLEGSLDTDIKCPELDIKGPNVKMDTSDINIGGLKGKGSSIDINVPNANIEFSEPKFEQDIKRSINVAVPDVNLSAKVKSPEVKVPTADVQFDAKGPTIKGGVDVSSSKIDVKSPELDVKASDISADIKAAMADLDIPLDKMTIPKFKHSQFQIKGPNVEAHQMTTSVSVSGAQGPNVKIKGPQANIRLPEDDTDSSGVKVKKGKLKMPKFNFSKSKGKSSIEGAEGEFSVSGPKIDMKGSKGSLRFSDIEMEGPEMAGSGKASGLDINTSPKGKSGTLDFSLFKGKKSERHRSSSLSDEHDFSPSSPKDRVDFGEAAVGTKGKKSKLKFGTFGGFGAKSKGSYEVTLGEGEAAAEGSGISLVSKKTRLSSSSSNESGSRAGFRLPKVELNINKNKE
ncbi:neuroblast differentiation-associated protein AHNAK isoform X3 [Stegostoma tigrinum]|uniref:neuroblast differentiation-associated protein AHNAK isoform X3 n=1 Tax=Stegostoma tigrinum TaxID=3053191 RepID=UPI0028706ADA|nr:neuroblast differentiation-associated protein AHNAK isoform X3 [Stegostoma tigrinum]